MEEPTLILKRAIDVTPHVHGIWCSVGGSKPFVNPIVLRRWDEKEEKIVFMLDTHNFDSREPEEEMWVVEIECSAGPEMLARWLAEDRARIYSDRWKKLLYSEG